MRRSEPERANRWWYLQRLLGIWVPPSILSFKFLLQERLLQASIPGPSRCKHSFRTEISVLERLRTSTARWSSWMGGPTGCAELEKSRRPPPTPLRHSPSSLGSLLLS